MDNGKRTAVLLDLIANLKESGSWCGETHIQKTTYFFQEMMGVDLEYDFILYKYGPYSFDLSNSLANMQASLLIDVVPMYPYGPSQSPSSAGLTLKEQYPKTIQANEPKIQFVAQWLGPKPVAELERLATALYVTRNKAQGAPPEVRAEILCKAKPHVSRADALDAVKQVDEKAVEASHLLAA